ncbi:MAG: MotA/TolQ/ExbB proton channel family protein [Endomicrobiales bacterium]
MDLATVFGLLVGFGLVIFSVLLAEGAKGFVPFLNPEAFFVVMGGTFCALLVNYPIREVFKIMKVTKKAFLSAEEEDTPAIIAVFVELAKKARTDGFLSLENDVKNMKNDFMKRGVQMVVDGLDKDLIANMMETELGLIRERHNVGQEIFTALGTYSPAFGIIGTVLGMILMLSSISDVEEVPRRMALALAAAFYGLGAGYLVFLPMSGKLRRKSEQELLIKEIIIRGVLLLQSGAIPSRLEENLKAYLEPTQRALVKGSSSK